MTEACHRPQPSGLARLLGLASIGLVGLCISPVGAFAHRMGESELEQLVSVIERPNGPARAQRAEALGALVALGPSFIPAVFEVLAGRATGTAGPLLDVRRRELLIEAVRSWPNEEVLAELGKLLGADATLDERLIVVELLGEVGGRDAIVPMVEILAGVNPAALQHRRVHSQAATALGKVLRADARSYTSLNLALFQGGRSAPRAELMACIARALGDEGRGRGMVVLERFLGRTDRLDATVIAALGEMHHWHDEVLDGRCADVVSSYLDSGNVKVRLAATEAAGRLAAFEASEALVAMLDDQSPRVRASASWALSELSGLSWGDDADRWRDWREREVAWFDAEFTRLTYEAQGEDPERVTAALRELSGHAGFRSKLAEPLARLVERGEPALAIAACGALERLDAKAAARTLAEALPQLAPETRAAAVRCLQRLTGEAAGDDAGAWLAITAP